MVKAYTVTFTISDMEPLEWALADIAEEIGSRGYNPHRPNVVRADVRPDTAPLSFTVLEG